MVDDVNNSATAAPVAAPAISAAASAPAAPVAESAPATPPVVAPAPISPEPAAETPPAVSPPAAEPAASVLPPTILGEAPKPAETPAEVKPAEGEKPAEAPKVEPSQSAEPAPLATYEPWTLPEGVTLDEAKSGEFNKLLGEFQATTKAEQAAVQKFGQELVSRHVTELKGAIDKVQQSYQTAWTKQTEDWKQAFISDPEIGGNRQETTVAAANEFIATHGGTPEQQTAFRKMLQDTGIGNHPEMIRMLASAKNSAQFSEGTPLPGSVSTAKPSRSQRFYSPRKA